MQTKEYPRDKYGYEIPRCHYVSPINGEDCNDVPMTGEHFCPSHNRRLEAEIRLAAEGRLAVGGAGAYPGEPGAEPWRQRAGGSNRRQPEPPPRIPPNLPRVTVRTHSDVLYFYEDTINHVRQGEMDVRVANCLGNLAMGALSAVKFCLCFYWPLATGGCQLLLKQNKGRRQGRTRKCASNLFVLWQLGF